MRAEPPPVFELKNRAESLQLRKLSGLAQATGTLPHRPWTFYNERQEEQACSYLSRKEKNCQGLPDDE